MANDAKTYQPGWGEKKHHHHHHVGPNEKNRGYGGALRMRDKQAYIGLMILMLAGLALGAYFVVMLFVNEWRSMPHDNPDTEMNVDELGIRKAEEQDALLLGDSLAQQYNLDSIRHHVQIDTRAPYRPPRDEQKWYITQHEWKEIWKEWKRKRYERKQQK